jgi:hypothetical protein
MMSTDAETHSVIPLVVVTEVTHLTFVPNTASHTHLTCTPAISVAKTPNNLNIKIHSICSIEKTTPSLLISIMAEKSWTVCSFVWRTWKTEWHLQTSMKFHHTKSPEYQELQNLVGR